PTRVATATIRASGTLQHPCDQIRCASATERRTKILGTRHSENKTRFLAEARQPLDRRIEVRPGGDEAVLLDEEMRTRRIALADDRHQPATFGKLLQQSIGHVIDRPAK